MSMLDLFRLETESQAQVLTSGLLALERNPAAGDQLEACMRAAHSLKGAARIVGVRAGVQVAHAMEDAFVAAQRGEILLSRAHIDVLLRCVDLFNRVAATPAAELSQWEQVGGEEVAYVLDDLKAVLEGLPNGDTQSPTQAFPPVLLEPKLEDVSAADSIGEAHEQVLRITSLHLNRLLGLTGEALVESRWLSPFGESLLKLKRMHYEIERAVGNLRAALPETALNEQGVHAFNEVRRLVLQSQHGMGRCLSELEMHGHRAADLAHRMYSEAMACRMRPFTDGVLWLPRMARDVARALGKQVRVEIVGESTHVDREILEKLEAPLGHLVRNAIDHGICAPDMRSARGKPVEGLVRIEARHHGGMLLIEVSDDGHGIDLVRLRESVVRRRLATEETAMRLSDDELMEFLFLPGFSMKDSVTDISGRGVGLDVVRTMVKRLHGSVRISSTQGKGTRFQLLLPLSQSVVRALLADVGGEPYAFPLAAVVRTLKLARDEVDLLEGRQFFRMNGRAIGLISTQQVLGGGTQNIEGDLPVIVLGQAGSEMYGMAVDRLLGEYELVVRALDPRLGKIRNVAAGALMEDGRPVLIVDIEDLVRSVEKLIATRDLGSLRTGAESGRAKRKRVLVVDDSLTVRELERSLLDNAGYEVEVAVDGMDGWNAIRTGHYDLMVTDIDMPRMDGIELVTLIKQDVHLKGTPVLIVSYKDREEDRRRGLDAGADYYLAKGSFHDESLLQAVVDLIGEGGA
jgi:two-component system sensor histidine kinase and response regulator WspE